MLDDPDNRDAGPQDALSGLSRETREVLASIGLGGAKKPEEEDDLLEEEIKVRTSSINRKVRVVTLVDLLYVKNAFSTFAIHHRTSSPLISTLTANVARQGRRDEDRSSEASTIILSAEIMHQSHCLTPGVRPGYKRQVLRTPTAKVRTEMSLRPQRRSAFSDTPIPRLSFSHTARY